MNILAVALYPGSTETVSFMLIGFVVVIGVLACLMLATMLMGVPFKMAEQKAAKKAQEERMKEQQKLQKEQQAEAEKAAKKGAA